MKCLLCCAAVLSALARAQEAPLHITLRPIPAYIESSRGAQLVNCDFVVENASAERWVLHQVEVSAYDTAGRLEIRKFVNDNGNSPSIETLNQREAPPGKRILIFNPLFSFGPEINLARLVYQFSWRSENGQLEVSTRVEVQPKSYPGQTSLRLPVKGKVIVWDGHDYYAHHRRFDYMTPHSQESGTNSNPDRYGYDFVLVNPAGDMRKRDSDENSSWFGFGQPVYAAGPAQLWQQSTMAWTIAKLTRPGSRQTN